MWIDYLKEVYFMNAFEKEYLRRCELDRKLTEQMVADGELTEEEGYFRNDMRRVEILIEMPDKIDDIE